MKFVQRSQNTPEVMGFLLPFSESCLSAQGEVLDVSSSPTRLQVPAPKISIEPQR